MHLIVGLGILLSVSGGVHAQTGRPCSATATVLSSHVRPGEKVLYAVEVFTTGGVEGEDPEIFAFSSSIPLASLTPEVRSALFQNSTVGTLKDQYVRYEFWLKPDWTGERMLPEAVINIDGTSCTAAPVKLTVQTEPVDVVCATSGSHVADYYRGAQAEKAGVSVLDGENAVTLVPFCTPTESGRMLVEYRLYIDKSAWSR